MAAPSPKQEHRATCRRPESGPAGRSRRLEPARFLGKKRAAEAASLWLARAVSNRRPLNGASGSWAARRYDPTTRKLQRCALGHADDFLTADGIRVLTYIQAGEKADDWFVGTEQDALRRAGGEVPQQGPYTVADAIRDYLADAQKRRMKGYSITQTTAIAYILPELGEIEVSIEALQAEDRGLAFGDRRVRA